MCSHIVKVDMDFVLVKDISGDAGRPVDIPEKASGTDNLIYP